jgi:RNA polymerase II elongation factor ELL
LYGDQIAEESDSSKKGPSASSKSNTTLLWRLKTKSWLHVRPYEWTTFSDAERTAVARKAQLALNDMKIPESDVAWTHVKSRNSSDRNLNGRAASPATAQTRASLSNTHTPTGSSAKGKRGVYSQEAKEQKSKTRPATKNPTVVLMKDESLKPRSSASRKSFELETRESNSNDSLIGSQPVTRRPGSGYKATGQDSGLGSGSMDSRNSRQPNTAGSVNALHHDRMVHGQSSRHAKPGGESEQEGEGKGKIRINKVRSDEGNTDRQRDRKRMEGREDKRGDVDRMKDMDRVGQREKIRERIPDAQHEPEKERWQQRTPGDISSTGAKRKTSEFDDPTYEALPKINFQKKRRTDSSTTLASSPTARESRPRELPKKPELPHTTRESTNVKPGIKKELSPLPPSRNTLPPSPGKTTGSSSSSSVHRTSRGDKSSNGASKFRRTSHIYTSSEDEAGPHQSVKREQVSAPLPPAPPTLPPKPTRSHQPYPHPSAHDALRKRYRISWHEYIATVAKVATQRSKIEAMLDRNGNTSDSDGDVEMMDADELRRLSARHIALREELEEIIRVFEDQC